MAWSRARHGTRFYVDRALSELLPGGMPRIPLVDALVHDASRAPIWLTMFEFTFDEDAAPRDPRCRGVELPPVRVPEDLQELVTSYSGSMTLGNGVHDSCAPQLVKAARAFIRSGRATPAAVCVAALRGGWWPEKIPGLRAKL